MNWVVESLKKRLRKLSQKQKLVGLGALLIGGLIGHNIYMANKRLSVEQETYKPLLGLISQAESKGNYNAYFGNAGNKSINFTKMSISEVLDWQGEFVKNGSPSSAVGRYQFLNTTLLDLVDSLGVDKSTRFNESTQDKLAIKLLERRGSEDYVNDDISKNKFAANLAMEWASLPKVAGENPNQSYYQADGINKALVEPYQVLEAIDHIAAE